MSKASAMAAAVQVEVAEDNAEAAVCEPTPVETFGCVDDDATTEVVVVVVEVVIVDVFDDTSNIIILYCCVRLLQRNIVTILVTADVYCDLVADLSIKHCETPSLLNPYFVHNQI